MKILLLITLLFAIVFPVNADSSLYERGRAYFYGDGVEQDYEKALLAFEHAAKTGDLDAITAIGIMHIVGVGVGQNDTKGLIIFANKTHKNTPSSKCQWHMS